MGVTLGQISSTSQGFVAAFQTFLTSDLMSNWRLAFCDGSECTQLLGEDDSKCAKFVGPPEKNNSDFSLSL